MIVKIQPFLFAKIDWEKLRADCRKLGEKRALQDEIKFLNLLKEDTK